MYCLILNTLYEMFVCSSNPYLNTVTCRMVRVTKMTGSSSDDWIY
jgi:hypothetical protein